MAGVAPFAGVWIEMVIKFSELTEVSSHPSRVCGLKSLNPEVIEAGEKCRTLRGCVD